MTSRALQGEPGSEIDQEFTKRLEQEDPKVAVYQFCQRFCNRPIDRNDLTYRVCWYPGGYQATVTLNCIGGQEFTGELAGGRRDAERSASQQVLEFYQEHIASTPKAPKKKKPRGGAWKHPDREPADPEELGPKQTLYVTVSKILKRTMDKDECMYETQVVDGGFQSTLRMPGLPGEWGLMIWAGEVGYKKKEAEQSAAEQGLNAVLADEGLMAKCNEPPKETSWTLAESAALTRSALGKGSGPPGNVFGGKAYWKPADWKRQPPGEWREDAQWGWAATGAGQAWA